MAALQVSWHASRSRPCAASQAWRPTVHAFPSAHPRPPPPCRSTGALATKFTLDQVLGFALWHASLAALHEPHRQTCAELARWPARQLAQQAERQRLKAPEAACKAR